MIDLTTEEGITTLEEGLKRSEVFTGGGVEFIVDTAQAQKPLIEKLEQSAAIGKSGRDNERHYVVPSLQALDLDDVQGYFIALVDKKGTHLDRFLESDVNTPRKTSHVLSTHIDEAAKHLKRGLTGFPKAASHLVQSAWNNTLGKHDKHIIVPRE